MIRYVLILCLCFLIVLASSDKKKSKHTKPNSKGSCGINDKEFHPHVEKRLFIPFKYPINNQLSAFNHLHKTFSESCSNSSEFFNFNTSFIELTWKYQFFESPHCIRIILDFGNLTLFKSNLNYEYYMFSYREFGKKNQYLKRNKIDDQENSLTLNRVHLKPYVVCVTFFNKEIEVDQNTTDCNKFKDFIESDSRVHDVDLCVDIDIHPHFLGTHEDHVLDGELIMVVFILGLLGVILVIITITHYFIERPHKMKMLNAIQKYIGKKSHPNSNSHSVSQSNIGSHNSLYKEKGQKENGPAITVSDYSNVPISNTTIPEKEEPKESDSLLASHKQDIQVPFVPVIADNRVMFHIGETIVEESPSSSQVKMNPTENENDLNEENQECIKTISHLLDDKPWSSSQAQFSDVARKQSRSNSFFVNLPTNSNSNHSNNTNHVHFMLDE